MQTLDAFLVALSMLESGGDYQIVNSLNFLGAYQFGEAALTDLGFVRYDGDAYDNNYGGGWTGKFGIKSAEAFLSSSRAQDRAAEEWVRLMWHYIELKNLDGHAWTTVGPIMLSPSGMLAATHLLGSDALASYIHSDGQNNLRDPYGTAIETYIEKMAGYDIPFAPPAPKELALALGL